MSRYPLAGTKAGTVTGLLPVMGQLPVAGGASLTADTMAEPVSIVGGREVIMLGGHNHLGLDSDPRVLAAAQRALQRYGTADPVAGTNSLQLVLEHEVADWLGVPAAVLCPGVAVANALCLTALAVGGPTQEGPQPRTVPDSLLAGWSIGARRLSAVDESRALGLLGPGGAGVCALPGTAHVANARTATLTRALASGTAFVAGAEDLVACAREQLAALPFAVPLSPASLGAALMAVRIARSADGAARRRRAIALATMVRDELLDLGYQVAAQPWLPGHGYLALPEVAVELADATAAQRLWRRLYDSGVYVRLTGTDRAPAGLSVELMATHRTDQVQTALGAFTAARGLLENAGSW